MLMPLATLLGVANAHAAASQMWTATTPFQLEATPTLIFSIFFFMIVSVVCIVRISANMPISDELSGNDLEMCPMTFSAAEDVMMLPYSNMQYSRLSNPVSDVTDIENQYQVVIENRDETDIENPCQPVIIRRSSSVNTFWGNPKVKRSFSAVQLAFGSDRPEVYLKMAEDYDMQTPCHCSCNHQSFELRKFPHINTTALSLFDSDSSTNEDISEGSQPAYHLYSFDSWKPEKAAKPEPKTMAIHDAYEMYSYELDLLVAKTYKSDFDQICNDDYDEFKMKASFSGLLPSANGTFGIRQSLFSFPEFQKLVMTQVESLKTIFTFVILVRASLDKLWSKSAFRRVV